MQIEELYYETKKITLIQIWITMKMFGFVDNTFTLVSFFDPRFC